MVIVFITNTVDTGKMTKIGMCCDKPPNKKLKMSNFTISSNHKENLDPKPRDLGQCVIRPTDTGYIMRLSKNVVAKVYNKTVPCKAIAKAYRGCRSQGGKPGCIQVGPLRRGTYNGESVWYYTMPAAKMDLLDWINSQFGIPDEEWATLLSTRVLAMFKEIARTLDSVHTTEPKVIHGDIKPENICVTDGGLFLIDFDDSVDNNDDHGHDGNGHDDNGHDDNDDNDHDHDGKGRYRCKVKKLDGVVGTYAYLAPEMREGLLCGTCTDAWSLGLVLVMLVNRSAYFLDNHTLLPTDIEYAKSFLTKHPLEGGTSQTVATVIDGLLEKNYQNRMTIPETLAFLQ